MHFQGRLILGVSVFALSALPAAAQVTAASPAVVVCDDTGFFASFLRDTLQLSGTCEDADGEAELVYGPGGYLLTGFGENKDLPVKLMTDHDGTAKKVLQFGSKKHNLMMSIADATTISFDVEATDGAGSCSATATASNTRRCKYEVVDSISETGCNFVATDILCRGCIAPCPKYGRDGKDFVKIFVGKPVTTCSVKIKRSRRRCVGCNKGEIFVPAGD